MAAEKTDLVVKSNRLIEASYRLGLIEQQIILYALCHAREEDVLLSPGEAVVINATDFASRFNISATNAYNQLKAAMVSLFRREVLINDTDPRTGKPRVTRTRWISEASYVDGAGQIQIIFAPKMIPFVARLETQFTTYRLEKIGRMTSAHAVRLYEILMQNLAIGHREIEIDWFKKSLQLDEDYPRIFDLKKRVIDVAVAQINEHSDLRVSYTQRKSGRTVTHLIFEIKPEPVAKAEKPAKTSKRVVIDDAYLAKHARPGEGRDQAYRRLMEEHGQTRLVA